MARYKKIGVKAKKQWQQSMDRLIDGLGRRIVVYLPEKRSECPNCYYDKIHDKSSGIAKVDSSSSTYFTVGRCPVCFGKGVRVVARKRCIEGIVIWNPDNRNNNLAFNVAGFEGATIVEIKTDVCHLDVIKEAKYIVIDGLKCVLAGSPILRGVGDKSVLISTFFTSDKPKKNSGEYV